MNGAISYSLVGNDEATWKYFRINEETGEVFTFSGLDAEYSKEYYLHVVAQDHGDPQLSQTVIVKVSLSNFMNFFIERDLIINRLPNRLS